MVSKKKVAISWSGGKDSAFALYKILHSAQYEVVELHTIINRDNMRVGMHGVRELLIAKQAESVGIPLQVIYTETSETHKAYEEAMHKYYQGCVERDIDTIVFGDIFLEDLRVYREKLLSTHRLDALYPLWRSNTASIVKDFITCGFKTVVCAANTGLLDTTIIGQIVDEAMIKNLPQSVDPCGENGEFHTFVFDGPIFNYPIAFTLGERVKNDYNYKSIEGNEVRVITTSFVFQDLVPA